MVYPWYASYLNADDPRRSKHPGHQCYNIGECTLPPPTVRSYDDYVANGSAFLSLPSEEKTAPGANVNGVKGIWAFHILPYAEHICWTKDFMHSGDHLIKDALNLFKKTGNGHDNRTQKDTVKINCRNLRLFPAVYNDSNKPPPWTLSRKSGLLHDVKLKNVIGALSVDIPKKIFKKRKGRNTHETISYGTNGWATWALHTEDLSLRRYLDCKLDLFDLLSVLKSGRIKYENLSGLREKLVNALVQHALLFPPSEQTYALHELIHVCDQIPKIGPPRFNNCYLFERLNLTMKRFIRNKCHSMPSIIKSYAVICLLTTLHLKCASLTNFKLVSLSYYFCVHRVRKA